LCAGSVIASGAWMMASDASTAAFTALANRSSMSSPGAKDCLAKSECASDFVRRSKEI
jgi:hypothetical protein